MKHLLKLLDWSTEEIISTLDLADRLKEEKKKGIRHPILEGKTLGMIFEKSSTRTRVSFEVGMHELGGQAGIAKHGADFVGHVARIPEVGLERVLQHFRHA